MAEKCSTLKRPVIIKQTGLKGDDIEYIYLIDGNHKIYCFQSNNTVDLWEIVENYFPGDTLYKSETPPDTTISLKQYRDSLKKYTDNFLFQKQ